MTMKDSSVANAFASVAAATAGKTVEKLPYFKPFTQGICTIVQFKGRPTKKYGQALFLEAAIETSLPQAPGKEIDVIGNRVSNSYFVNNPHVKAAAATAKDAKKLMLAALDMQESDVSVEDFNQALADAISDEQPLRGVQLRYWVEHKVSEKVENGKIVTKEGDYVQFSPVKNQKPEDVKSRREALNKTHPISE
jgi:hypothetical protein